MNRPYFVGGAMDIDLKGPTVLIFDVSDMISTLDGEGELSPLAWQYMIERELVEKGKLTIGSTVVKSPYLAEQYRIVKSLLERYPSNNIVDQLDPSILEYLSQYVVEIMMTNEVLLVIKRKVIRSHPCRTISYPSTP